MYYVCGTISFICVLALDEFAHFRSAKGSTSEDMYAAATPATIDFHHKKKKNIAREDGEEIEEQEDMYAAATPVTIDFHHQKKKNIARRMEKK